MIGARFLEHFVEEIGTFGRFPRVLVLNGGDMVRVGGVSFRLRLLLAFLLGAVLSGRLRDIFRLAALGLLVLPEDGLNRLLGVLRPSLLTRSRQVVPARNAPMTSESVTLGSSVCCFENHRM
jgi:hypothetical protein